MPDGTHPVMAAVRAFLQDHPGATSLRVAFSGGRDSSVLLHALAQLRPQGLEAWHVNHGLRPDAEAQAAFCVRVAEALEVPLTVRNVIVLDDASEGPEAAARRARYTALREGLGERDLILTAQHADDQAETFLLAALRGSGPEGLQGMRVLRREGDTWLGRPLLAVPGESIAGYARVAALDWYHDPSNDDTRFDRNFLRREIFPRLAERFPVYGSLARCARWQREAVDRLASLEDKHLPGEASLEVASLAELDLPARRARLRAWLRAQGLRPPGHVRLEEFCRQLEVHGADRNPELRWADGWMGVYRGTIYAEAPDGKPAAPGDVMPWPPGHARLTLPDGRVLERAALEALGVDAQEALEVGFRRGGETVVTPAGRRPLKKRLQERGVPPWAREHLPLVRRRADGTVVAILWPDGELGP
ncbi:tRNA lysidine(34) synthetase TilS [Thioalkalivibrio sp. HL-Eb18]|uniref:tRNA lysidine(34) synthetase TilS n=1 Tax=Thioalkalivibrio sp. HL-Eb18 TaxID=1266913 RepID=UPI00036CAB69|nr:tRNA lysidine(34) synthetase TilS [Thioalkalivibrio sp. HL-Eb18]